MKVLMITSEYPPYVGGIANHVYELVLALDKLDVEIDLWIPQITSEAFFIPGINTSTIKPFIRFEYFYNRYLGQKYNNEYSKKLPDIVHIHGVKALGAAKYFNVPVVFTNHTTGILKKAKMNKLKKISRFLKYVNFVIAPSIERVEVLKKFSYKNESKFIANGANPQEFFPITKTEVDDLKHKYNIDKSNTVILLSRRLHEKNGVVYLALASKYLKKENIVFVIAGDGDQRSIMEKIFKSNGAKSIFLGNVNFFNLVKIYNICDFSVLPSLYEATSLSCIESMMCAKAVIASNIEALKILVKPEINGMLFEPANPYSLAKTIKFMLKNRSKIISMGNNARNMVLNNYTWEICAKKVEKVYQKILLNK